jgi:prolyl-tRNA synthetase
MDLIGIPYQIVVGPRGLASGTVEVKTRAGRTKEDLPLDAAINRFAKP